VTAVVVGPREPVEAGIWELLEDMLWMEIETKPHLTEHKEGDPRKTLTEFDSEGRKVVGEKEWKKAIYAVTKGF
jgi:hypothetical protein